MYASILPGCGHQHALYHRFHLFIAEAKFGQADALADEPAKRLKDLLL
jgi:hypothetical protein